MTHKEVIVPCNKVYSIDVEDADIIVRSNRDTIDQEALAKFLDDLDLETVRKRSQLTEAQATALANEIDRATWDRLKSTFTQE